jgi:hypothetical protein
MKNILIVTSTRDNQGAAYNFIKDINDVKDPTIRKMIESALSNKEFTDYEHAYQVWASSGICGGEYGGYIFNDYPLPKLPLQVDHILTYVF